MNIHWKHFFQLKLQKKKKLILLLFLLLTNHLYIFLRHLKNEIINETWDVVEQDYLKAKEYFELSAKQNILFYLIFFIIIIYLLNIYKKELLFVSMMNIHRKHDFQLNIILFFIELLYHHFFSIFFFYIINTDKWFICKSKFLNWH